MASQAHAFFCFEVLAAAFDEKQHVDLKTVLDLYDKSDGPALHDSPDTVAIPAQPEDGSKEKQYSPPQIQSISRLQADENKSRSAPSTPSSVSVNSSTSQLTDSTDTSMTNASTYASRLQLTETYPLFITWNLLSKSGQKSLRGCIGTFEALPLEKGLEQYALTSAFEDTRFSPIPVSQLPKLSCSLTLLANFEEGSGPMDWSLGVHGIRISFTSKYRRHGATYLPDVAVEQGWSKEETLESLMRKAGWEPGSRRLSRGSAKPWEEVKDFKLVRYTGLKASASYLEWQQWRTSCNIS